MGSRHRTHPDRRPRHAVRRTDRIRRSTRQRGRRVSPPVQVRAMIWGAARRRARVDAAVAAYTQWRSERDAVRAAYRVWSAAGAFGEPKPFETYQSALDREERTATTYASPMSRGGHLPETGLAHQLARMQRVLDDAATLIMLPAPNRRCVQPTSFEHSQHPIT